MSKYKLDNKPKAPSKNELAGLLSDPVIASNFVCKSTIEHCLGRIDREELKRRVSPPLALWELDRKPAE